MRFGEALNIDKLISFYPTYEEPLFRMKSSLHFYCEKLYKRINQFLEVTGEPTEEDDNKLRNMINLCLENEKILSDELYLTLIKF